MGVPHLEAPEHGGHAVEAHVPGQAKGEELQVVGLACGDDKLLALVRQETRPLGVGSAGLVGFEELPQQARQNVHAGGRGARAVQHLLTSEHQAAHVAAYHSQQYTHSNETGGDTGDVRPYGG